MSKSKFVYVTYIETTPDKVWQAIVKGDMARQYWGHENVSDWKVGSKWSHVRAEGGNTDIVGEVLETDPPRRLVISWASPKEADDRSKYSRVTFDIEPMDAIVRLTVTHDDLEAGSSMERGVSSGWPLVLSSLKSYLETGRGYDVMNMSHKKDVPQAAR